MLSKFQVDFDHYEKLKKQDAPKVPVVKDSDADKKIINWAPVFVDCIYCILLDYKDLSHIY